MTDLTLTERRLLAWHTLPCDKAWGGCGEPVNRRCITASGARTIPHKPRMDALTVWLSRQPEVDELKTELDRLDTALEKAGDDADLLRQDVSDRDRDLAALKLQVGTLGEELRTARAGAALVPSLQQRIAELTTLVSSLRDQVATLEAYKAAHPDRPPVTIPGPPAKHQIGPGAVFVTNTGDDANPGTDARPKRTLRAALASTPNPQVVARGVFNESLTTAAGQVSTLQGYPGQDLILDGGKTLARALIASGRTNLYDLAVRGYAPSSIDNGKNAAVYYGGTAADSEIENVAFSDSKMAHLGLSVPDMKVRASSFNGSGFSAIMAGYDSRDPAADCDRLLLEDLTIAGANRDNHPAEPTTAGIKITRATDVLVRRITMADVAGAYGVWFDVDCTNPTLVASKIDGRGVAGRAPMRHCVELELGQGGLVAGNELWGSTGAGLRIFDTRDVRVWANKIWANLVAIWLQQDTRGHQTTGNEICNNDLDGPSLLWAYDDQAMALSGADMVGRLAGNTFGPKQATGIPFRFGRKGVKNPDSLSLAQVATLLGGRYAAAKAAVPADVAAHLPA